MSGPSQDIIRMMDAAGLESSTFLTGKKSMSRIVIEVRAKLLNELLTYLKEKGGNNGQQPTV